MFDSRNGEDAVEDSEALRYFDLGVVVVGRM